MAEKHFPAPLAGRHTSFTFFGSEGVRDSVCGPKSLWRQSAHRDLEKHHELNQSRKELLHRPHRAHREHATLAVAQAWCPILAHVDHVMREEMDEDKNGIGGMAGGSPQRKSWHRCSCFIAQSDVGQGGHGQACEAGKFEHLADAAS